MFYNCYLNVNNMRKQISNKVDGNSSIFCKYSLIDDRMKEVSIPRFFSMPIPSSSPAWTWQFRRADVSHVSCRTAERGRKSRTK